MADAEKKKSLTAKRIGHKSYATKCTNAAKLLLESKDGENRVKLTTYLKIISERKYIIAGLDNEILDVLDPSEYETEILSSGDYQLSLEETIFNITDVLDKSPADEDSKYIKELPDLEDLDHGKIPLLMTARKWRGYRSYS